ncbi:hypothetical protein FFT09_10800 [Saccharomonospora piscinae]|uniref:hypothetical protein n=1 Tax=Saccharomonospora piscinae TaxID=687388 RepID=UPI001106831F|nr:hypothetical protein [Saccharomonospora piscinae]TLW93836.1 hypothetical protein FFT09_10800 [Saccharomonospora piscinae]
MTTTDPGTGTGTTTGTAPDAPGVSPPRTPPPRRSRGFATAAGVCVVVALLAQLPLIRNRVFYFWDDSAAQFLPMWHRLGERIAAGHWPPLLDLDSWMGGNLAGEALFGVYNPVNVANYLLVAALPDLGVASVLVKTEFLVLLALGLYLVCREYGAARPSAACLAVALPFSGYLLYFDASTWAAGLIAFAFVPHVWWTARRAARGGLNPLWAFVAAGLAVTAGNPYGVLGVAVVLAALLVEFAVRRRARGTAVVLGVGVCAALLVPLVFLPLLGSAEVTWRSDTDVVNDGFLVPGLTDLLAASTPTHLPHIGVFGGTGLAVPAAFFVWFALPLVPWLDWRVVRQRWRLLLAPLVVTAVFAVAALGPSKLWLFRWPIRHLEYCFLGAAVVLAVVLSSGLRTDRRRARGAVTAGLVALGGYLAWAATPESWPWHLGGVLLVGLLAALVVAVARRRPRRPGAVPALLGAGTAAVLGYQLAAFPANTDVSQLNYPHSVSELRTTFADRYPGEVMQVADMATAERTLGLHPDGAWRYFLFGNVYAAAGVESLVSYTGLGFRDFVDTFCLTNSGSTSCPEAWDALWRPTGYGGAPLADLLRVETVVVQNALVPDATAGPGWRITERDDVVTVLRREAPLPWPEGTLSWASPGVTVSGAIVAGDAADGTNPEWVRYTVADSGAGPQRLVFARLAWPGYHATVNGTEVPVEASPAGLVTVTLPPGVRDGELELRWSPPGQALGVASAGLGVLGALVLAVLAPRWGQTSRRSEAQRESS